MNKIKQITAHKVAEAKGWEILTKLISKAKLADDEICAVQIALGVPITQELNLKSQGKNLALKA